MRYNYIKTIEKRSPVVPASARLIFERKATYKFPSVNGSPDARLRRVQIGLQCAKRYSLRREISVPFVPRKGNTAFANSRWSATEQLFRVEIIANSVAVIVSRGRIAVFLSYWRVVIIARQKGYGSIL